MRRAPHQASVGRSATPDPESGGDPWTQSQHAIEEAAGSLGIPPAEGARLLASDTRGLQEYLRSAEIQECATGAVRRLLAEQHQDGGRFDAPLAERIASWVTLPSGVRIEEVVAAVLRLLGEQTRSRMEHCAGNI